MPTPGNVLRGASLYSGIFDSDQPQDQVAAVQDSQPPSIAANNTEPLQATNESSKELQDQVHNPSEPLSGTNTEKSKTPAWSAALRFAPRKTAIAVNKPKPRPNAALVASFSSSSAIDYPVGPSAPSISSSKNPTLDAHSLTSPNDSTSANTVDPSKPKSTSNDSVRPFSSIPSLSSVPSLAALIQPEAVHSEISKRLVVVPVLEPPPYTLPPEVIEKDKALARKAAEAAGGRKDFLEREDFDGEEGGAWEEEEDDDVNGFFSTATGKRASKKKQKNKRKRGHSPPAANMDADYEPRVPNDYTAYREMVNERRKALLARSKEDSEHSGFDNGDDYDESRYELDAETETQRRNRLDRDDEERRTSSQDEREDEERQKKFSRFAPPTSYGAGYNAAQGRSEEEAGPRFSPPPSQSSAFVSATSSAHGVSDMDAPSVSAISSSQPQTGEEAYAKRLAITAAATGEEAYLRRLAMSQGMPPPPRVPRSSDLSERPPSPSAPPKPPAFISSPSPLSLPASAPDSFPPSVALTSGSNIDLPARQKAAAAIAARLAQIATNLPQVPPSESRPASSLESLQAQPNEDHRPDPHKFAERLMTKYGYKKGEGLGADGNKGVVEPLTVAQASGTSHPGLKQKAMGTIVNSNVDPRTEEDKFLYGSEPSQVILLENMVTPVDLKEDDDLIQDIGEECNKFGIVERIFPYIITTSEGEEEVRIFVKFSGLAGSWKAVRGLNGRFFGGKKVAARYYQSSLLENSKYDD